MELRGSASIKRLCFVVGVLVMVASTHFAVVESRVLKSVADGEEKFEGLEPIEVAASVNNKVNSLSSSEFRSLSFVLASGPSKKGPGH